MLPLLATAPYSAPSFPCPPILLPRWASCLRMGSGWHSTYQRRNRCFQREALNQISQKASLTPSLSSHLLHLEEKRFGSCQSLITSAESDKKKCESLSFSGSNPEGLGTFAAVCLPFVFSLFFFSNPHPWSKFPVFLSKKKEDRLSLRDFKGVFWILPPETELLRCPQILLH